MSVLRILSLAAVLGLLVGARASAQETKPELNDKQFRRAVTVFLEDPLGEKAKDIAKFIMAFASQTPKAVVFLGKEEMKWFGKRDDNGMLLLAAYAAGNVQSQLDSGVKRNDRYAGLLSLFHVHRALKEKGAGYENAVVDDLLKLHREDKLLPHLIELEQRQPSRLTPEQEKALKKAQEEKK
jgi:hypothetical protein